MTAKLENLLTAPIRPPPTTILHPTTTPIAPPSNNLLIPTPVLPLLNSLPTIPPLLPTMFLALLHTFNREDTVPLLSIPDML